MTSSDSNIIQIVESGTELGANQRVSRWVKLTSHAIWLEAEDTCSYIVDIISPTSHNRVSLNAGAWDTSCCKTFFKSYKKRRKKQIARFCINTMYLFYE